MIIAAENGRFAANAIPPATAIPTRRHHSAQYRHSRHHPCLLPPSLPTTVIPAIIPTYYRHSPIISTRYRHSRPPTVIPA